MTKLASIVSGRRTKWAVALGILLDTFIVRTIMVPAAVELLGDRIWWPSGPRGGSRILEEASPEQRSDRQPTPVA